jgi:hypothetical protein
MHAANGPVEPRLRAVRSGPSIPGSRFPGACRPAVRQAGTPGDLAAGGAQLNSTLDATGHCTSHWSDATADHRSKYAASSPFRDRPHCVQVFDRFSPILSAQSAATSRGNDRVCTKSPRHPSISSYPARIDAISFAEAIRGLAEANPHLAEANPRLAERKSLPHGSKSTPLGRKSVPRGTLIRASRKDFKATQFTLHVVKRRMKRARSEMTRAGMHLHR